MRLKGCRLALFCSYFTTIIFLSTFVFQARAVTPVETDCSKLLIEQQFVRGMFESHQSIINQLKKSDEFHQFCRDRNYGQNCEALATEDAILGLYGAYVLEKINTMEQERSSTLLSELQHHGLRTSETDGYEALAKLSLKNASRLAPQKTSIKNVSADFIKALDAALDAIEFGYVHNSSRHNVSLRISPTLSTRVIVRFGLGTPLNTAEFNTDILKSDGNVFFHVVPKLKQYPTPRLFNRYGQYTFNLVKEFAHKHGWISPFLMNPYELTDLFSTAPSATNEQLARMVKKLSRTDFKPDDILELLKATARHSLIELWKSDSQQAEVAVKGLSDSEKLERILDVHGMQPLGFPHGLELKVPLYVPQHALGGEFTPGTDAAKNSFIDLRLDNLYQKPKPQF